MKEQTSTASNGRTKLTRRIAWVVSLVAVFAVGVLAASASRHESMEPSGKSGAKLTSPTVRQIYALGRLEPAGRILRLAAASGNDGALVGTLHVAEGDLVSANQVLVRLDNYDRRVAAKAEAVAKQRAAAARLAQVKAGAKTADIDAQSASEQLWSRQSEFALRELERARQLKERNVLAQEELDSKQWSYDRVVLEQRRSHFQLASIREVREVDVEIAAAELAVAEAAVVRAEADLAAAEVRAPTDGRVLKIHARRGERLPDSGLLEMGNVLHMQAVAEVFEADVISIQPGQIASVLLSSANVSLTGTVAEVGFMVGRKVVLTNDPVSDTDARVVEVRIDLSPEESQRVERLSQSRVEVSIAVSNAP